jgi:hypothetical protein
VDGDIFSRVTALPMPFCCGWPTGGAWDPFYARRAVDVLVSAANGIPSLQAVVDILHKLEHHARDLALCTSFEELISLDPDARHATNPPTDPPVSSDEAEARTLALFGAYAKEISDFLLTSRPTLRPRPINVRKENERDLFAAAG